MSMNTFTTRFAGFQHDASELSAYAYSIDTFVVSLKNKEVVRFVTTNPDEFIRWLNHHGARNINDTLGKMVHDYYFNPPAPLKGE